MHYQGRVRWTILMKIKSGKIIRGYRTKFSVQKNLTFSGQEKIADIIEKIANKLAITLKRELYL